MRENRPVCAVIVTYNIGTSIRECVDSVRDQVDEIIFVDNASDSVTQVELERLSHEPSTTVIFNSQNNGIATAINQGVKIGLSMGYDWFLTLDHDSQGTAGMVNRLLQTWNTLEAQGFNVGIVAANPFDRNSQKYYNNYRPEHRSAAIEVPTVLSSGSLINKKAFQVAGFFNEQLFLYYVDDDFCLRLRHKGLRVYLCPSAVLLHREGNKAWRRFLGKNVLYDNYGCEARYYIARNAVYILRELWKCGERRCFWQVASRLVTDTAKVLLFDEKPFQKFPFILKGIRDGVLGKY